MRILALDPGLRSGWATWNDGEFRAGITDPEDTWDLLDRWTNYAAEQEDSVLICERFTITPATGKKSAEAIGWPLELIGVSRMLAGTRGIAFARLQQPAEMKRFATEHKMRAYGFWTPGAEDHARDAAGHLLLFMLKHKLIARVPL